MPCALAGTAELYRGRRLETRVLAPVTLAELLGDDERSPRPAPGSHEELRLARQVAERLGERLEAAVAELVPRTIDPPDRPRRWRWLAGLF
ncbi:MAG: hypothetical protein ACXWQ6_11095 [Candidatus Limnocylindrales bacterium]